MIPLKNLFGLGKIGLYYLMGRRVNSSDYGAEYDCVAATYDAWLNCMSRHTDLILNTDFLPASDGPLRMIDLACGTGYVTSELLRRLDSGREVQVTCVDVSSGMLEQAKHKICDSRAEFVQADGLEYLSSLPENSCHAVYCGLGLVYLPMGRVISECGRVLQSKGIAGCIMNRRGTLDGLQDVFLGIMTEHSNALHKVMDIQLQMPSSEKTFSSRFIKCGFEPLNAGIGEEAVCCSNPEELYRWLHCTGVIAGTDTIFENPELIRRDIIDKLAAHFACDGRYRIHHKYVYGIYRRFRDA